MEREKIGNERDIPVFLAVYPQAVREIAIELRRIILSTMPGAQETLDRSARVIGYGFGTGYRNTVCTIIPSKIGVKLGIAHGAELTDFSGLLQGSGKVHRYVQLIGLSDLKRPELKLLLLTALTAWQARSKRSG